jgi:type VI secretion system protein ImpG
LRDDLLFYYERELTYLRRMGAEFAQKYPKIAGRLLLEAGKCEDPHVERLLEGFAFLAARIHLKLDDEFPDIVEAMFSILYPHFLRPVPSMSVVQFHLDREQGRISSGLLIPRESVLYSAPVSGAPCKFRTCYDTTIWPFQVSAAEWKPVDRIKPPLSGASGWAALRLELECFPEVRFDQLDITTLRLFLLGNGGLTHTLVELLSNNCLEILARDCENPKKIVTFPREAISQVGFAEDEGMTPFPRRSFWGYRLLGEYFTFPEKFLFLDIAGFDRLKAAGFGGKVELIFLLSEFERKERQQLIELGVNADLFRLGCVPVVNLFAQTAEPILVEQKKYEYRIVPDARREQAIDIFSVDEVTGVTIGSSEMANYEPFYSFRHSSAQRHDRAYWHISRRVSGWRTDKGPDVYITFVNLTGERTTPDRETVTLRLTCSNRDLPSRLPFGNEEGDFQLEGGGPIQRIVALVKPTDAILPPARASLLWRLASQLSLNYLSLVSEGADAFREILKLHNFGNSLTVDRQIQGILDLRGKPHFTRLSSDSGVSFARGTRVELEFDEEQFAGSGIYTFASVIDRFLGLYTSMNSFSQLVVRTRQRKGVLKQWPARSGQKILM